jgi:predicted PhzF superfamily epimerase YddE/YHI9
VSRLGGVIETYHVHAFTQSVHGGNPAGVCILDTWLSDDAMRRIAVDLGPSVTAFVLNSISGSHPLRWFTRGGREVHNFCGHATFCAAHVMLRMRNPVRSSLDFLTVSGVRRVAVREDSLAMTIPYWPSEEIPCPQAVYRSIVAQPIACLRGPRDLMLVFGSEAEVNGLQPDYDEMRLLGDMGIIATARRGPSDVVFRFFCPGFSISEDEDHATGSALSTLAPYWSDKLASSTFSAHQTSARGANLACEVDGGTVTVFSHCATFLSGIITTSG